ncbi:MAG: hypothetical protein M1570_12240 [Chloroflexi bacterium]|nr:hypothetical protein [Chloroflexota bacterium]
MEQNGWLEFFRTPRDAAEARMRALASKATVRKARAKAELEFRSEEVAANWRDWTKRLDELSEFDRSRLERHIPPHWRAGVRYAHALIAAYGAAALNEMELPNKFEAFLRECAGLVAARTYAAKLQPYDSLPLAKIDYAVANFHQLVRAAVADESARLGLEAWRRYNERLDEDGAGEPAAPTSIAEAKPPAHGTAPSDPELLARDREARLQSFLAANHSPIAAVSDAALVHKPDMQRWRHGELSEDSVMSQRIESVLAGKTPLKTDAEKRAPAA